MNFFTADLHLGHNKPFIYENRGFKTIEDHDREIEKSIKAVLGKNDTLWILGDVAFENSERFLNSFNCTVKIVKGNHDKNLYESETKLLIKRNIFLYKEMFDMQIKNHPVTLCHYPMVSWNKSHFNAWLLYGHVHNHKIPLEGKMLDVAPTPEHLYPYSENEIEVIMNNKPNNWNFIDKKVN